MEIEIPIQQQYYDSGTGKVWIQNTSNWDFTQEFRGSPITIKAHEKIQMRLLEAERFLSLPKPPAKYLPTGELAKNSPPPKALQIIRFTEDEILGILPKKEVEKLAKESATQSSSTCAICGGKFISPKGLDIHVSKMHPDWEPISKSAA